LVVTVSSTLVVSTVTLIRALTGFIVTSAAAVVLVAPAKEPPFTSILLALLQTTEERAGEMLRQDVDRLGMTFSQRINLIDQLAPLVKELEDDLVFIVVVSE
jgi:hypothetical protein